jgi:hypothetical protein
MKLTPIAELGRTWVGTARGQTPISTVLARLGTIW